MNIAQAIIAAVICLLTLLIGIFTLNKEPYQASIKNGGFSSKGNATKNVTLNKRLLVLSIMAGILLMILLLAF